MTPFLLSHDASLVQLCGQLSPAGTGSQTLSNALHALRGSSFHSHHIISDAPCYFMTLRDPARRLESGFRYEVINHRGGRPRLSAPGFRSVSHFVDLLRSANKSYDSKRAWRLLNLSWNKTSPGDDGSFFMRAQVTYIAAAKTSPIFFLCTDRLTQDMELLFRNASMNEVTANTRQKQASPELLRRSSLSAEAAWYFRSLFAADWTYVQRHCPHVH